MLVVLAHISVVPGCEGAFEDLARRLCAATLALESGILRYEYVRMTEPATYLATLAFVDHDAFLEHQASAHHHSLAGAMRELIAELRLERVEPFDRSIPSEPEVFPPTDEAELSARREHYRTRYPLDRVAWWDELR